MSKLIKKLTDSNYEELAAQVAREFFPEGTLVSGCGITYDFGLVTSISKAGKITVQKGNLPLEKVTDNENKGGTYGKFWYRANPGELILPTEVELLSYCETSKTRFSPRCYMGKDWEKNGYSSPIMWSQEKGNRMFILTKPKVLDSGLIMQESYCS